MLKYLTISVAVLAMIFGYTKVSTSSELETAFKEGIYEGCIEEVLKDTSDVETISKWNKFCNCLADKTVNKVKEKNISFFEIVANQTLLEKISEEQAEICAESFFEI